MLKYTFWKRFFDVVLSLSGLIILLPVLIFISLMIKVLMPGPVMFTQIRVGKNEKKFKIYKFRTMKVNKKLEEAIDTSKDKERTTKLGYFLRRTKLDELPQLFNVLNGDMSLVGPRPTIERQVIKYSDMQKVRLNVRPGMTGLAQVKGGTKIPWENRINIDIEYVETLSFLLDIKILILTIKVVLFG